MKNLLLRPYLAVANPLRGKIAWDVKNPNPAIFQPCILRKAGLEVSAKAWETEQPTLQEIDRLTKEAVDTLPAWEAYKKFFMLRYKVAPLQNAATNSQMKQLVQRLGKEAPAVLEFYLSRGGYYYSRGHGLGVALAEAEKLRTEWASNNPITKGAADAQERRQETLRQLERIEKGHL
jgi:hypothetical protein